MRPNWSETKRPRRPPLPRVWRYRHQLLSVCARPHTPESRPDEPRDRPPPLAHKVAEFDCRIFGRPSMNIDEKAKIQATSIGIWPKTTLISRKTIPERTLRRRRAEARSKWPTYLPDVARGRPIPGPRAGVERRRLQRVVGDEDGPHPREVAAGVVRIAAGASRRQEAGTGPGGLQRADRRDAGERGRARRGRRRAAG